MARKNVYLGKVVKDISKKGLDSLKEVEGICKAIINDFKRKKIDYRTAMSRLNLLSLIITKSRNFTGMKERRALRIIENYRKRLMSLGKQHTYYNLKRKNRRKKVGIKK